MDFKKILIIQTAFLGDVVMTTPLVRAVSQQYPHALIDVLVIPQSVAVFVNNPHVHAVHTFDKRSTRTKLCNVLKTARLLRRQKYDAAISTTRSLTNSLLMVLAGINMRVGFVKQKFLTHPVTHPRGLHMRERYMALIKPFSSQKFNLQTEMFWTEAEAAQAQEIMTRLKFPGRPIIGLAPGSVWETKKWPKIYFMELMNKLYRENMNLVLLGGPEEKSLCEEINKFATAINMAGELSINGSAALINLCDLMLSNDSAPLHMANAVQTDVFAFFGPTVRRFGCYPFRERDKMLEVKNLECRPCAKHGGNACPLKHFNCMLDISPDFVFTEIMTYMESRDYAEN